MAHPAQSRFVEELKTNLSDYFINKNVLEVGSLNINGSVRPLFENCQYTGLDVGEGKGVDIVCSGHKFDAPNETYDTVLSTECFEHNPHWVETLNNMIRMCKSNGLVFFTCATDGRPEHGTSRTDVNSSPLSTAAWGDYYRNLNEADFRKEINFDDLFKTYKFSVNTVAHDIYFWGIRK